MHRPLALGEGFLSSIVEEFITVGPESLKAFLNFLRYSETRPAIETSFEIPPTDKLKPGQMFPEVAETTPALEDYLGDCLYGRAVFAARDCDPALLRANPSLDEVIFVYSRCV